MSTIQLRPPLPPPLSHDDIPFISPVVTDTRRISHSVVAAIAAAISELLPAGDFVATADGSLCISEPPGHSAWLAAGRVESIEREPR